VSTLSARMREGSMAEHRAAEASVFVTRLLEGGVDAAGYTAYLLRLQRVYAALERTARAHLHHPGVVAVHDPDLERSAALEADLEHWAPGGPREVDSPAVAAYERRIEASTGVAGGAGFAAHHYTRYLGDLSGGQAIGRTLDRTFDLGGRGTDFYRFDAVPRPKPYKDAYRLRLDGLDLDEAQQEAVVAEVQAAFALNQALFVELAAELDLLGAR